MEKLTNEEKYDIRYAILTTLDEVMPILLGKYYGDRAKLEMELSISMEKYIEHLIFLRVTKAEQSIRADERGKVVNKVLKYLSVHQTYCSSQNGLPYCKNCGLDVSDLEEKLSSLSTQSGDKE